MMGGECCYLSQVVTSVMNVWLVPSTRLFQLLFIALKLDREITDALAWIITPHFSALFFRSELSERRFAKRIKRRATEGERRTVEEGEKLQQRFGLVSRSRRHHTLILLPTKSHLSVLGVNHQGSFFVRWDFLRRNRKKKRKICSFFHLIIKPVPIYLIIKKTPNISPRAHLSGR